MMNFLIGLWGMKWFLLPLVLMFILTGLHEALTKEEVK